MQKHITAAETPVRVVIVTLDNHLASAVERARRQLSASLPNLELVLHAASDWGDNPAAVERCRADIAKGDIVIATMLFMEDHIQAVLPALEARRDSCDAIVGCMAAQEIVKLTRLGRLTMDGEAKGALALLKKLRGSRKPGQSSGSQQMAMLRRLPRILKFVPGTAQDLRAYFLMLQYWLAGSDQNIVSLVRFLIDRYASGPRAVLKGRLAAEAPIEYPEIGLYHPRAKGQVVTRVEELPLPAGATQQGTTGTVGLLIMRSYVIAGNAAHYDGVIAALEAKGLRVLPAFASGLDAREAVEHYFVRHGRATVDAVVSLTGFSLVGGPAYNDAKAAEEMLARLDVPYVAAHPVEFQTLQQWARSDRGLTPVEATMMVAIPEIDGATAPIVYGGRSDGSGAACTGCPRACQFPGEGARDMHVCAERADMLAARVARRIALRKAERAERRIAIVLFNFPPNAGSTGTAAFLAVYESLFNTLKSLAAAGYSVTVPDSVDALRTAILGGNSSVTGTPANVHARIAVDDHVRRERWLDEIEAQWGPAPGRHNSDGTSLQILGERFGNVFVGIQPAFGYEGDPMRLLFERSFAPTHAFSAFYRWLREDFGAHAVLHFGTHGALEFMPGKQTGLGSQCWPDRLIADLPNIYLYAANNPSEGTIAKRRSGATLVSYLTPPITEAGLYRGLIELKALVERFRGLEPEATDERQRLAGAIQAQAAALELVAAEPAWVAPEVAERVTALNAAIRELEYTLIPSGLHVVGAAHSAGERADLLSAMSESAGVKLDRAVTELIVAGDRGGAVKAATVRSAKASDRAEVARIVEELAAADRLLAEDHEASALIHALDGRFVRPAPGGDLLRTRAILPTGRNVHGFDPYRIPSAWAVADGRRQADRLLARHVADGNRLPEQVALVLWGTDNLKTEGGPIAQALALLGAKPRFDQYGRLAGADLVPLAELGRPRIDVLVTVSGIFRDLLPLQVKLLAEACYLAAAADEPLDRNFVRAHALAHQAKHGCDLETASLRVFSNADGAYGSNVSHLIENGRWEDEDELADTYASRKSFAYGRSGAPVRQSELLGSILAGVDLAYQNLESVELGVTTIDHYFDTLGGMSRSVRRARGGQDVPVYIGDQTRGQGTVRTLSEQVALETRTRMLNPKWYEGMLKHGYEGVRQIEAHITNTMGWSATTGQVQSWVYQQLTETYMLDPEMRERMAKLNPTASAKVASRLLEAHERQYWTTDSSVIEALRQAGEELEDRLEGVGQEAVA